LFGFGASGAGAGAGEAFAATGLERRARTGYGESKLMRQRAVVDFAVRWMEANRR